MTVYDLNAQVLIDGSDVTAYVESIHREAHLVMPPQEFKLVMKGSFNSLVTSGSYAPFSDVVIYEEGTKVFTGYVDSIEYARPAQAISVYGRDTSKLANDWFITESIYAEGETVGYWIDYWCTVVGLSYTLDSSGSTRVVGSAAMPLPMGQQGVLDVLKNICGLGGMYMRVNPAGLLTFNTSVPLNSTGTPDFNLATLFDYTSKQDDAETRNICYVDGYPPLYEKYTRTVEGMPVDRKMVYANPEITQTSDADELADWALDQFAVIPVTAEVVTKGDPDYTVGDSASFLDSSDYLTIYNGITDLTSDIDKEGYRMRLALGRRGGGGGLGGGSWGLPLYPVGVGKPCIGICLWDYLTAWWKLDEASGAASYIDSSGNGYALAPYYQYFTTTPPASDGTIDSTIGANNTGTGIWHTYNTGGGNPFNTVYSSINRVQGGDLLLNSATAVTVAFWCNFGFAGSDRTRPAITNRIATFPPAGYIFGAISHFGNVHAYISIPIGVSGSGFTEESTSSYFTGAWMHVVFTLEKTTGWTLKMYINGALSNTSTIADTGNILENGDGNFYLANAITTVTYGYLRNDKLDEVMLWNGKALSLSEIQCLYARSGYQNIGNPC